MHPHPSFATPRHARHEPTERKLSASTVREAERRKARSQRPRHTSGRYRPNVLRARRAPRMIRLHEPPASGALALRRSTAAFVDARTLSPRSRPRFTRTGGRGRYPRHCSRLSQAPGSPVVMPAGTMPGPPGCGVYGSARGNRPRSLSGSTLGRKAPHTVSEVEAL